MESVGKKRSRPRRAFTPEFKAEIVELYQRSDRSMRQVALDFDLTETAMRSWVKQAELDADIRSDGLTSDEQAELAELRRENRRLQQDVDILKRLSSHPGDPVNVYPFTAAEQAGKHNVKRACELLQVSRSAYYQHARGERSTRGACRRAADRADHRGARGVERHLRSAADPRRAGCGRTAARPQTHRPPDARRRGLRQEPAPLEEHHDPGPARRDPWSAQPSALDRTVPPSPPRPGRSCRGRSPDSAANGVVKHRGR
jgi:transposase